MTQIPGLLENVHLLLRVLLDRVGGLGRARFCQLGRNIALYLCFFGLKLFSNLLLDPFPDLLAFRRIANLGRIRPWLSSVESLHHLDDMH